MIPTEEEMEQLQQYVKNLRYLEDNDLNWSQTTEEDMEKLQKYVDNLKYIEENT